MDALKIGRKAKKTCRQTKKMFGTAQRWKQAKAEASVLIKQLYKEVQPQEEELRAKIASYTQALEQQFAIKNKASLDKIDRLIKEERKALTMHRAANLRIAVKHGYTPRYTRSLHDSRAHRRRSSSFRRR